MANEFISKDFEYNGFKYDTQIDNFYIFRRTTGVKIETCKATRQDVESGRVYRMMDTGFSRM